MPDINCLNSNYIINTEIPCSSLFQLVFPLPLSSIDRLNLSMPSILDISNASSFRPLEDPKGVKQRELRLAELFR